MGMKSVELSQRLYPLLITALLAGCILSNQVMAAGSRGISINLRATERADAPVSESVTLYENSYALVIGNDEYTHGWPKLTNAIKDAELIGIPYRVTVGPKGLDEGIVEITRRKGSQSRNVALQKAAATVAEAILEERSFSPGIG